MIEIYDLDPLADSTLANISTRGTVSQGDNIMASGFILRGSEPSTMVVRALGPTLGAAGVRAPLPDPSLTLHDASGVVVAANNDWKQAQQAELEALGLECRDDREAAILTALPSGAYTAVVRGANGQAGIGLVEIYRVQ